MLQLRTGLNTKIFTFKSPHFIASLLPPTVAPVTPLCRPFALQSAELRKIWKRRGFSNSKCEPWNCDHQPKVNLCAYLGSLNFS